MSAVFDFWPRWSKDTIFVPTDPHPVMSALINELELILPSIEFSHVTIKIIKNHFLPPNSMMWDGTFYLFGEEE